MVNGERDIHTTVIRPCVVNVNSLLRNKRELAREATKGGTDASPSVQLEGLTSHAMSILVIAADSCACGHIMDTMQDGSVDLHRHTDFHVDTFRVAEEAT